MRYVLSSAVVKSPGEYTYALVDVYFAREWLTNGPWTSGCGYAETAACLARLTGVHVQVDRRDTPMAPGDEALVFRLTRRLPVEAKGRVDESWVEANSELGLLVRHR